jgi:hypothetical protein
LSRRPHVRDLRRRKPAVKSRAYFDAALADRHAKRAETLSERAGYAAVTDFDKVIAVFVRTGVWSHYAGPEPGMGGCRAPADLLAKHGIDAATGLKLRARRDSHYGRSSRSDEVSIRRCCERS